MPDPDRYAAQPKTDGKIDALSDRMDRMSECIDKQSECLDIVKRHVSEAEGKQVPTSAAQNQQQQKVISKLLTKAKALEAHSLRNKLHIVGLAESTNVEKHGEICATIGYFSNVFVVCHAHRSLPLCPRLGARPSPIISSLLNYHAQEPALFRSRELKVLRLRPPVFSWWFPQYSLLDAVLCEELAQAIDEYFCYKMGSTEKFVTVWESFKAYIWGGTISEHADALRSVRAT
ncbi:hypothetical protein NDU88_005270 [Pleurodeles waltl]|uniref:Uncharacterized protein n=1 Tax=Pleurodeles waltl TaxID=8319 RepID=A0AAV7N0R2_PLEWA|nr:hypothetical protein NDU88_005270 [Pleurodeles waltl]